MTITRGWEDSLIFKVMPTSYENLRLEVAI